MPVQEPFTTKIAVAPGFGHEHKAGHVVPITLLDQTDDQSQAPVEM
jgi:hypothetical protein